MENVLVQSLWFLVRWLLLLCALCALSDGWMRRSAIVRSFRESPWLKIVYVLNEVLERNRCQIDLCLEGCSGILKCMF